MLVKLAPGDGDSARLLLRHVEKTEKAALSDRMAAALALNDFGLSNRTPYALHEPMTEDDVRRLANLHG